MIAVHVGGDAVTGNAKLARKANSFVAASAGVARKILLRDGRVGILVRLNGVDSVTVRADGRKLVPASDRLAVNARVEGVLNVGVALPAGSGDVELVDWRLRIVAGQDRV